MGDPSTGMKALVTGGGGFLGSHIARMLLDRGEDVTVLGRRTYPQLASLGIKTIQAELSDHQAVNNACAGMDMIFHVGAMTAIWGKRSQFVKTNVEGTRNVIAACRHHDISRLIYTSTPSVVFGDQSLCNVDESHPYPQKYLSCYAETKAIAEQMVLAANGPQLATVSLRPHLIWGPGDPHLIPRVIEQARKGHLIQVGDGNNLVDITYIDNAAQAHLNAAEGLHPGSMCSGKVYFISQGEAVSLWPWLNQILQQVGAPIIKRRMSYKSAYRIGAVLEFIYRIAGIRKEPRMTRFLALQLSKSHYFNIEAAKQELGYVPAISTEEGVRRLVASYQRNPEVTANDSLESAHERLTV